MGARRSRTLPVRTSAPQREVLALLRSQLKEWGYHIFPIAPRYRKHRLDFIGVPKDAPQCLVAIHPLRSGAISVRPFADLSEYKGFRARLSALAYARLVRWSNRQLPFDRTVGCMAFLSRTAKREYAILRTHP